MAKITIPNLAEYEKKIAKLGAAAEGVCKYAVYEAAGMVVEAIKQNTPVDSGDLRDSCGLTDFKNDKGYIYTQVVFPGYDSKGVPNPVKARVLESGRSSSKGVVGKHPFIRKAVDSVKKAAQFSIETNLNKKLEELMKE